MKLFFLMRIMYLYFDRDNHDIVLFYFKFMDMMAWYLIGESNCSINWFVGYSMFSMLEPENFIYHNIDYCKCYRYLKSNIIQFEIPVEYRVKHFLFNNKVFPTSNILDIIFEKSNGFDWYIDCLIQSKYVYRLLFDSDGLRSGICFHLVFFVLVICKRIFFLSVFV